MARKPGQIIKRGPRKFIVRIYMGEDPASGKRRYMNRTVNGSAKDAQRLMADMLTQRDLGTLKQPSKDSLGSHLDVWLKSVAKPRVSPETHRQYTDMLKHVRGDLGDTPLVHLRPQAIQAVYARMDGEGLSARTIKYVHTVLKMALKQAVAWDMIASNPAEHVHPPKQEKSEVNAMSPKQATAFLQAAKADDYHAYFATLLYLGVRPSEGAAITWADIDFAREHVSIRRTLKRPKGGGWKFGEPKTASSRRSLHMPDSLAKILTDHRSTTWHPNDAGLVFTNTSGNPVDVRNVTTRNFPRILAAAGLPDTFRMYDLRHTCATLLMLEGVHPKVVSDRLGHSSIRETMDTYSHVMPTMQEGASSALEKALTVEPERSATWVN